MDLQSLLDSYDSERRPIGERVAKTSLYNMQPHALVLDQALGLTPENSEEENVMAMRQYFDPTDESQGKAKRQEVQRAMNVLDIEFYAHAVEVGWFYELDYGADYGFDKTQGVNPQLQGDGEMELCVYHPNTRPGSQLPHAWLVESDAKQISTRELVPKDRLLLIAMSTPWKSLIHALLQTVVVDGSDGGFKSQDRRWKDICADVTDSGALIVRPDNIIAYRFIDDAILHRNELDLEFSQIVETVLRQRPQFDMLCSVLPQYSC